MADGSWSTGFCDCCSDCSDCFVTCCCPCITFGQVAEIVDRGSTCVTIYVLVGMLTGGLLKYSFFYRTKIREQYNISGNCFVDCLSHTFCELCALTQLNRELESRGFDVSMGWEGNVGRRSPGVAMSAPVAHRSMNR